MSWDSRGVDDEGRRGVGVVGLDMDLVVDMERLAGQISMLGG